jgi:hypothetical protein
MLNLRRDLILVHLHRQDMDDFLLVTGDCLDGNIEKRDERLWKAARAEGYRTSTGSRSLTSYAAHDLEVAARQGHLLPM